MSTNPPAANGSQNTNGSPDDKKGPIAFLLGLFGAYSGVESRLHKPAVASFTGILFRYGVLAAKAASNRHQVAKDERT